MALPVIAAGITAAGGSALGALGAAEARRNHREQRKLIMQFQDQVNRDINRFDQASSQRIRSQGADIAVANQRSQARVASSLARQGTGTLGSRLIGGVRASGAQKRASFEQSAFASLGERVAKQRQELRQQVLMSLAQLGAEPSIGYGALQGLAAALPGAADVFQNITEARK